MHNLQVEACVVLCLVPIALPALLVWLFGSCLCQHFSELSLTVESVAIVQDSAYCEDRG